MLHQNLKEMDPYARMVQFVHNVQNPENPKNLSSPVRISNKVVQEVSKDQQDNQPEPEKVAVAPVNEVDGAESPRVGGEEPGELDDLLQNSELNPAEPELDETL